MGGDGPAEVIMKGMNISVSTDEAQLTPLAVSIGILK